LSQSGVVKDLGSVASKLLRIIDQRKKRCPQFPQRNGLRESRVKGPRSTNPLRLDLRVRSLRHCGQRCIFGLALHFRTRSIPTIESRLRTRSAAVVGKHKIGECTSRTNNDDYKYAYNECRHAGNLRRPNMGDYCRPAFPVRTPAHRLLNHLNFHSLGLPSQASRH
jgi:hypothetical protein